MVPTAIVRSAVAGTRPKASIIMAREGPARSPLGEKRTYDRYTHNFTLASQHQGLTVFNQCMRTDWMMFARHSPAPAETREPAWRPETDMPT